MNDLLEKLTTYNLFNYFLPGLLFSVIGSHITIFNFVHSEIVISVFIFYFVGLVISRIGSLFLEPFLKKISFLKFVKYADYVRASKEDPRIEEFSEVNNMYRTMTSMLLALVGLKIYEALLLSCELPIEIGIFIGIVATALLFLFSYRKQTSYISQRVKIITKQED